MPSRTMYRGASALAVLIAVGLAVTIAFHIPRLLRFHEQLHIALTMDDLSRRTVMALTDNGRAAQPAVIAMLDSLAVLETYFRPDFAPIPFDSLRIRIAEDERRPARWAAANRLESFGHALQHRIRSMFQRQADDLQDLWILFAFLLALTVLLTLSFVISTARSEATVRAFRVATMRYAQGHFEHRIPDRGSAGQRELIELFNTMGDQLQELERLKGEFFNKLVHDFKSPLDNIKQSADVLLGDIAEGSLTVQQRDFLQIIKRSATHLRSMVQEQLDESKLIAGQTQIKYERLDIKSLILDRIQLQKPAAKNRQVRFSVRFTDVDFVIDGDRSKLARLIDNLLSNAIKYTAEGSAITVELDDRHEGMIEFRIRDQGPGIPESMQEKVFHKYVRLARTGHTAGTGLGLYTAKYIVDLHKGQIWIKSRENEGATFHVLLPRQLS